MGVWKCEVFRGLGGIWGVGVVSGGFGGLELNNGQRGEPSMHVYIYIYMASKHVTACAVCTKGFKIQVCTWITGGAWVFSVAPRA